MIDLLLGPVPPDMGKDAVEKAAVNQFFHNQRPAIEGPMIAGLEATVSDAGRKYVNNSSGSPPIGDHEAAMAGLAIVKGTLEDMYKNSNLKNLINGALDDLGLKYSGDSSEIPKTVTDPEVRELYGKLLLLTKTWGKDKEQELYELAGPSEYLKALKSFFNTYFGPDKFKTAWTDNNSPFDDPSLPEAEDQNSPGVGLSQFISVLNWVLNQPEGGENPPVDDTPPPSGPGTPPDRPWWAEAYAQNQGYDDDRVQKMDIETIRENIIDRALGEDATFYDLVLGYAALSDRTTYSPSGDPNSPALGKTIGRENAGVGGPGRYLDGFYHEVKPEDNIFDGDGPDSGRGPGYQNLDWNVSEGLMSIGRRIMDEMVKMADDVGYSGVLPDVSDPDVIRDFLLNGIPGNPSTATLGKTFGKDGKNYRIELRTDDFPEQPGLPAGVYSGVGFAPTE